MLVHTCSKTYQDTFKRGGKTFIEKLSHTPVHAHIIRGLCRLIHYIKGLKGRQHILFVSSLRRNQASASAQVSTQSLHLGDGGFDSAWPTPNQDIKSSASSVAELVELVGFRYGEVYCT